MPLSKHHIDRQDFETKVDFTRIKRDLIGGFSEIVFAYVLGSAAKSGWIKKQSDFDLAVYFSVKPDLRALSDLIGVVESSIRNIRCDLGILNAADPVYCFESLKGRLLFTRDEEVWLQFYTKTCREYESTLFHYHRQRMYRLETP